MEFLIIGAISILTSVVTSTLIQKKKSATRLLTFEQGQQLASRIKSTEQEQSKYAERSHKLNNKILAQTQEFNERYQQRHLSFNKIYNRLGVVESRLEQKCKNPITNAEVQEILNEVPSELKALEKIEDELSKITKNNQSYIKL